MEGISAEVSQIEVFAQYGIAGLILFVSFALLLFIIKSHSTVMKDISKDRSKEAEAWRQTFDSWAKLSDNRQSETNEVLRSLSVIHVRNEDRR